MIFYVAFLTHISLSFPRGGKCTVDMHLHFINQSSLIECLLFSVKKIGLEINRSMEKIVIYRIEPLHLHGTLITDLHRGQYGYII
jgi:hypothetical protein